MILKYFNSLKIHFDFILESPGVVFNRSIPGINYIVGILGVTRLGLIQMNLTSNANSVHSIYSDSLLENVVE